MRIMGIDPGIAITGYGILDYNGSQFRTVDYGAILTEAHTPLPRRLNKLYNQLKKLLEDFQPRHFAVEQLFFNKNTRTALTVGQARGVILLAAEQNDLQIAEYTPLQVKQAVVGEGRAEKQQVQYMIRLLLGLAEIPRPDDVADALAIAVCHAYRVNAWRGRGQ